MSNGCSPSVYYTKCAGAVPLGNTLSFGRSGREPELEVKRLVAKPFTSWIKGYEYHLITRTIHGAVSQQRMPDARESYGLRAIG